MAKSEIALGLISDYENTFRHPDLEKFKISGLFDLHPEKETEHEAEKSWPNEWIFCGSAGVYMFLDENLDIAYIGKTKHFGYRFGSYFANDDDKKCKIKNTWKTTPRFVITIAVPDQSKFESAAIEEFLLSNIVTTDNTIGNKREE
jgi:hypothetical protein